MKQPPPRTWQQQFERMRRSHARLGVLTKDLQAYEDDLLHFFMDCWHLKDWIDADTSVPQSVRQQVVDKAEAQRPIRIAADLANGAKHFAVTRSPREGASVTAYSAVWEVGSSYLEFSHQVTLSDGSVVMAQQAAEDAVAAWLQLPTDCGLLTSGGATLHLPPSVP